MLKCSHHCIDNKPNQSINEKYCMKIPENKTFEYVIDEKYIINIIIKNNPVLRDLKYEVSDYFKKFKSQTQYCLNNYNSIQSYYEYFKLIIKIANIIDLKEEKMRIKKNDKVFVISTRINKAIFDFINMIFTENKLFLTEKWNCNEIKEIQEHPIELYYKAIDLIKSIQYYSKPPNKLNLTIIPLNGGPFDINITVFTLSFYFKNFK
jgi:hypothetical protein